MFKKIILFLVLYSQFKLKTRTLDKLPITSYKYTPSEKHPTEKLIEKPTENQTKKLIEKNSSISTKTSISTTTVFLKYTSISINHSISSQNNVKNFEKKTISLINEHKNIQIPKDNINCIESKIKNLINLKIENSENRNQYFKDLYGLVKQRLLDNCKSYLEIIQNKNNTKEIEEFSIDIKEFLVNSLGKVSNFELILNNISNKNKEESEVCKYYFILEIKKMYYYLYTKGDYWKNYQSNFLSLLNDFKNIKAKNELDTVISSNEFFDKKYEKYIPFLYKYIEYIPFLKHIMIIKNTNIIELYELLKNLSIEYMAFDNSTTSKDREYKLNEINEILFIILLIKNELNELNITELPLEFYWFILKNPNILNNIITHINNNGDDMFQKSLLNNNYYNLDIKEKIIVYLKTNIIIRIKDKYFDINNDIYKQISDKNTRESLKNIIFDLINVYDDYIYFMEKILSSTITNVHNNDKKEDLENLFIKEINSYNIKDNTVKKHSENFYKFILHNSDHLISSKNNNNDDSLMKILIDITVGISEIDENAILKLNKSNNEEIIRIIIELVKKVDIIKNKDNKNIFVKNIIKIMFMSMLSNNNSKNSNQLNYKKHFYDILIKYDYMLKELINEYSYYEIILKDFINKNQTNVISKTDFLGINNESKLPKGNINDQFIIYELIGHFIIKANFENYKNIIKEFVGNCNTFINETKRKNYLEKFILTEFNEDKREVINLKISNNNYVKLTKINKTNINLLPIFLNNNINKFIKISSNDEELKILKDCPYDPNTINNVGKIKRNINYTPSLTPSSKKIYLKNETIKKVEKEINPKDLDFRL